MRKPGGQQGNQNARIHGYYSKILDEDEQKYSDLCGFNGFKQGMS